MGGVKGDFAGLRGLSKRLARLTGVDVKTAEKLAPVFSGELQKTFDARTDPYGNPWPPTKTQGPRVLNDEGKLRKSATSLQARGRRIRGKLIRYGRYQRPELLLTKAGNAPPGWDGLAEQAAEQSLREIAGQ
jgi:hypothetical protein